MLLPTTLSRARTSQDPLRPYYEPERTEGSFRATLRTHARHLLLVLSGPAAPPYTALQQEDHDDPTDNAESGSGVALRPAGIAFNPSTAKMGRTFPDALAVASWHLGHGAFLVGMGAVISVVCSIASFFLGLVAVAGWVAPFDALLTGTGVAACAVGGAVIGGGMGV
ncbi:hypothetical protein BN946_scf184939.g4 [Trametes cinnabarina]|uniref:Uncharacterized protein n=1 Tax=Pycnoporus cinnabarinus TaxID=5643 RepID=A0A060SBQ6_PYCCI|nr:hypothetical protein BN946_scf184939.g4 [Trametes cinnabarina]